MTQQGPRLLLIQTTKLIVTMGTSLIFSRLRAVCYENDDGGLSHKPYKIVVAVKSLHNFSNSKPSDPYAFKEELKIKLNKVCREVPKRNRINETITQSGVATINLG